MFLFLGRDCWHDENDIEGGKNIEVFHDCIVDPVLQSYIEVWGPPHKQWRSYALCDVVTFLVVLWWERYLFILRPHSTTGWTSNSRIDCTRSSSSSSQFIHVVRVLSETVVQNIWTQKYAFFTQIKTKKRQQTSKRRSENKCEWKYHAAKYRRRHGSFFH